MSKTKKSQKEKVKENKRNDFLKKVSPEDLTGSFPMFINRQDLTRYLVLYEIYKKILDKKGAIIECGVYKGGSLMMFAQLSAIFEPYAFNREIIGFDTFEGFPNIHNNDGDFASQRNFSNAQLNLLKESIKFYDSNRPIGHIEKVKLVKGDAVKTIPKFFRDNSHMIVSLLYLDFDLYEPTKVALETILPRMPKGSIIVFDELNQKRWPGETMALLESLKLSQLQLEKFREEPHICYGFIE